jgi:sugar transferase (PEP-CTERM/EpsH1 system associated)
LWTGLPLSVEAFYSKKLQDAVDRLLAKEKIDCIFTFSSTMAEYVARVTDIPRVMDFVDMDSEKWRLYASFHTAPRSVLYKLESRRLSAYERQIGQTFDHSIVISEEEAITLRRGVTSRPISVIPNGVDLNYFQSHVSAKPGSDQPLIVFSGAMDYFPNIDAVDYFCAHIFPRITQRVPHARLCIVGRSPDARVRALSKLRNVEVTGTVPDVRPFLSHAHVAVAPLRIARGIQNKILEAMAMRLPVVGTSCAFQGILANSGDGIRIADTPDEFAQAVTTFLLDQKEQHMCSAKARAYVERHHHWETHLEKLASILHDIKPSSRAA